MHFYELHEGDDEVFGDIMLAHDELFEPDEFFEMVQAARRRVQDGYTHDTLIEAIAEALENEYGFTPLTDERLSAAVFVSPIDEENAIVPVGIFAPEPEWGEDDEGEPINDDDDGEDETGSIELEELPDYVTIVAELRPDGGPLPN